MLEIVTLGNFMVDTMILFKNKKKSPSHECLMPFWSLTSCSDLPTDHTLDHFMTVTPKLTFTESREVSVEYLQQVGHASRERLPFQTPGSVAFWTCICSNCWVHFPKIVHWPTFHFEYAPTCIERSKLSSWLCLLSMCYTLDIHLHHVILFMVPPTPQSIICASVKCQIIYIYLLNQKKKKKRKVSFWLCNLS